MSEAKMRVVIYAGRRRSLASVLLTWALVHRTPAVKVIGVVCPSEFRWKRISGWHRRFGRKFFKKVLNELGLLDSEATDFEEELVCLRERCAQWRIRTSSVQTLCRQLNIPFIVVSEINTNEAVETVSKLQPDCAVYSGAGILKGPIIEAAQMVLNLHCGPLPEVRGMNAVEWSLFFGMRPEVTLHYIDKGIDTGRIIASRRLGVSVEDSIALLRGRSILTGIDLLVDSLSASRPSEGKTNLTAKGRQYFAMSETLKSLLQFWIKQGKTPILRES